MNTIRQLQNGEPALERRSLDASLRQTAEAKVTEASVENAIVVGGGGSGKDDAVNAGDLLGEDVRVSERPAEVRVAIVALKSGNADGAKGDRKANASSEGPSEEPSISKLRSAGNVFDISPKVEASKLQCLNDNINA